MKKEEILAELEIYRKRIEFLENELKKQEKFEFKHEREETFIKEALQLNKESNIVGAAEQINVDYSKDIDWNDINPKYYIYYNYRIKSFSFACNNHIRTIGTVYMSEEKATRVCEILNNKEVEL